MPELPTFFRAEHIKDKVFSIHGTFPPKHIESYATVDKFLWELIELDREGEKPFVFVIASTGGCDDTLWAILDTIKLLKHPVYTVGRDVYSAAALLFMAGRKGHRYLFEYSRIALHSATNDSVPQTKRHLFRRRTEETSEARMSRQGLALCNQRIAEMVHNYTDGKILSALGIWDNEHDINERIRGVKRLLDQTRFFVPEEAIRYGVADRIISEEDFRELF